MKPETLDALASLYLPSGTRGARAPRTFRLDSDGTTISVRVPAPATLARVEGLLPGAEAGIYRTGTAGLATASGSPLSWSLRDLAERLVERIAGLPTRADASPAYGALRTLCRESSRLAPEYALDVVKAWRRSLPKVPEPEVERESRVRQYPKEETARKAERRERYRRQEEESSRFFFRGWLEGDEDAPPPAPGSRAYALALLREAVDVIGALADVEETVDDADEIPARVPGPRTFYRIGDEVLGHKRKRTRDGDAYWTVPAKEDRMTKDTRDAFAEAVLDRVARLVLEENREALESFIAEAVHERDRLEAATGTDGTIVPLRRS